MLKIHPTRLRGLCLFGGVLLIMDGIMGLFYIFDPLFVLIQSYLIIGGLIMIVLESKLRFFFCTTHCKKNIEYWAKFLTRIWGRGMFYIFLGTLSIIQYTVLNIAVGVYVIILGIALMLLSYKTVEENKSHTEESIKEKFNQFDRDKRGVIDVRQLEAFLQEMGEAVPTMELHAIADYLDVDRTGSIDFEEFKKWWMTGKPVFL